MLKFPLLLATAFALMACASAPKDGAVAKKMPSFVEHVSAMEDGSIEVVVSGQVALPTGNTVASINMKQRLEQAAAAECAPRGYILVSHESAGMEAPKRGGLKVRHKGVIRCVQATPN